MLPPARNKSGGLGLGHPPPGPFGAAQAVPAQPGEQASVSEAPETPVGGPRSAFGVGAGPGFRGAMQWNATWASMHGRRGRLDGNASSRMIACSCRFPGDPHRMLVTAGNASRELSLCSAGPATSCWRGGTSRRRAPLPPAITRGSRGSHPPGLAPDGMGHPPLPGGKKGRNKKEDFWQKP